MTDPYVEAVQLQLFNRSEAGLKKYGTDLTREDLSYGDWLQHLQEELMDASLYVERLKSFRTEVAKEKSGQEFRELQKDIYENAVAHGWWEQPRTFGDIIALCHSELSEALEESRNGKPFFYYQGEKPEGIAIELADVIIRILDYAGRYDIDMWDMLKVKDAYNKTRDYRHGGKVL